MNLEARAHLSIGPIRPNAVRHGSPENPGKGLLANPRRSVDQRIAIVCVFLSFFLFLCSRCQGHPALRSHRSRPFIVCRIWCQIFCHGSVPMTTSHPRRPVIVHPPPSALSNISPNMKALVPQNRPKGIPLVGRVQKIHPQAGAPSRMS